MRTYNVVWEMDIDAENPEEAARRALEIQRDKESIATCFKVFDRGVCTEIDLTERDEEINPHGMPED